MVLGVHGAESLCFEVHAFSSRFILKASFVLSFLGKGRLPVLSVKAVNACQLQQVSRLFP